MSKECDDAYGDAVYSAWRRGLNPDRVDRERVCDLVHRGEPSFRAAEIEVDRLERRDRQRREEQRAEEEYWERQEQEYRDLEAQDPQVQAGGPGHDIR